MSRGGNRLGSGSKLKWNHGQTKTIRVPIELADKIIEIAHGLDQGLSFIPDNKADSLPMFDSDTESKSLIIDLSGVSLISVSGQMGVRLGDLISKGYQIKPSRIQDIVIASLRSKK